MRTSAFLAACLLSCATTSSDAQYPYFDWLAAQSQTTLAISYRTDAEIQADTGRNQRPNALISYDAGRDAARAHFPPGLGSYSTTQIRPGFYGNFFHVDSGNVLFTWDVQYSQTFDTFPAEGIRTHKAYQLSYNGGGDSRRIEIRTRFSDAGAGEIAKIDVRRYVWGGEGDSAPMGRGGCGGQCQLNEFTVMPETWTRFWAFVDFESAQFSLWVADENRAPVQLFDNYPLVITSPLNAFWFEWNSSQSRTGGADAYIWFRNFVVMRDLSDPDAVVAQGARFGADTVPPAKPAGLALK